MGTARRLGAFLIISAEKEALLDAKERSELVETGEAIRR